MHDRYDDEIDGGLDEATIVVVSSKIKKLGIESEGKLNISNHFNFSFSSHICKIS